MEWIAPMVAIVTLLMQVLAMVLGGVWVVANVKTTTAELRMSIRELTASVKDLRTWLKEVDDRVDKHTEQLVALETKVQQS